MAEALSRLRVGTAIVLAGRVFMGGAGLLATMLLTRLLTPAEVGVYFMLAQIVNVARLFSEAGMNIGLQKLIGVALAAGDDAAVRRHTAAAFAVLGVSLCAFAALLVALWQPLTVSMLKEPALLGFSLLALPWLLGFSLEDLSSVFFRSLHEIKTSVLTIGLPRQALLLLALAALWLMGQPADLHTVISVVAATWGLSALQTGAMVAWRAGKLAAPGVRSLGADMAEVLRLSLPMMVHTGGLLIMNSSDIWVLQIFKGSEDVGVYGALTRISVSMAFFIGAVNMVLPPMLARLHAEGKTREMEQLLRRSAGWGAWLAVPMTLVFVLGGPWVLSLAFTPAYAVGSGALAALALAHCFNTVAGSPGFVLQMTGSHVFLMRLTLIVAAVNLVGNLVLVGPLGMLGVALSTGVSLIVQNILMVWQVRKRLGVSTWVMLRQPRSDASDAEGT